MVLCRRIAYIVPTHLLKFGDVWGQMEVGEKKNRQHEPCLYKQIA